MTPIPVRDTHVGFVPDPRRVLAKPFLPGEQIFPDGHSRTMRVINRVLEMPHETVAAELEAMRRLFSGRHRDLDRVLAENFALIADNLEDPDGLSGERRLLLGAYFTHEYSVEGASVSNPSIVPAPDQEGLADGEQRFVMSLRAVGEGHISSIEFRTGVIDADSNLRFEEASLYAETGARKAAGYEKRLFQSKLTELGVMNEIAAMVLGQLPDQFGLDEINNALVGLGEAMDRSIAIETARTIHWLASSNYTLTFDASRPISERVIFPAGPTESRGMEDARFVRFQGDGRPATYFGTYTAFDGFQILPQLIETTDFVTFRVGTLQGGGARNKGIAIFPRLVDGQYAALSRQDNENNYLMLSNDVRIWGKAHRIQVPRQPWELIQLGNCGSPLETDAGWLVLTHGVGPLRRYSLGAILLDLDDPQRVIGHLDDPILVPGDGEREGYVPNVVYSCGSMINGDDLVLPYGYSDTGAKVAIVSLPDLLTALTG